MTTKTPRSRAIESAYFHTGNSGITFQIMEATRRNGKPSYRLDVMHGAMGAHSTFSVPLDCDHMAEWFTAAMGRIHTRMKASGFEANDPFDSGREDTMEQHIEISNGLKRVEITKEYVVSRYETVTKLLGYNEVDETGKVVNTVMLENPIECGNSGGSKAEFKKADIGKEVVDGKVVG